MSKFANGDLPLASVFNKTFNALDSVDIGDPTTIGEGAIELDTKRVLISTDGVSWDEQLELRSRIVSSYWHACFGDMTSNAGTWEIADNSSQTDYDDALVIGGGYINNTSSNDLDEIGFGTWAFHPGNYKVSIAWKQHTTHGIMELHIGTQTVLTKDCYGVETYDLVETVTWANASREEGEIVLKVNGKNASSTDYYLAVSRIEIFRIA